MNLRYKSEETVHGSQGGADPLTFKGKKTWMESTTHKSRLKTDDTTGGFDGARPKKPLKDATDGCIHRYPYGGPWSMPPPPPHGWGRGRGWGSMNGDAWIETWKPSPFWFYGKKRPGDHRDSSMDRGPCHTLQAGGDSVHACTAAQWVGLPWTLGYMR